jgi:DNA polymerase-3 subunit delta'
LHIQPVKNSISIDAVRDLQRDIAVKPFHRGRKVYLIDDCHLMTVQAQNALLKTLEEPVGHAVILMTADSGSQLLPTVLSRCQQVILKPVSINLLEEYLQKKYKAFPGYISFAAAYSHGIVGKAVEVVENENFQQQREEIIRLIHSILQGDSTSIIKNTEFFVENEDRVFEILDFIILWMRDIIMLKEWPQGALINVDKRNMLAKHAINFTTGCIKYIISIIEETKQLLLSNSNYRLTMEVMLLRIQEVVTCRQW